MKAPYNFVPLNKKVLIPSWQDKITHDIPFSDGEDGYITLTLTNTTPLFIRDGKDDKSEYSCHIETEQGRLYFLPGSSVKGMLRSVAEILSFGKMNLYNNDSFGYREVAKKGESRKKATNNYIPYSSIMNNVHAGWLVFNEGKYIIKECHFTPIPIEEIPAEYGYHNETIEDNLKSIFEHKQDFYPQFRNGRLVCSGPMIGKKHEHIFFYDNELEHKEFNINAESINTFKSVYKPSPYYEFIIQNRLEQGEEIPVFFTLDRDKKVQYIGLTRNFRLPYAKSVADGINQILYNENGNLVKEGYDMCECIFGYTKDKNALRGRVQIGHAFASKPVADNELCETITGVMGTPQASFYPLYLRQTPNQIPYNSYKNEYIEIAGRKRYRTHANENLANIPQGNDNHNVTCKFKPLKEGQKFYVTINLHNMRPAEIGLILSAITFHNNSKTCFHNIGLGKGLGCGKLEVSEILLHRLKYNIEDYMKSFEFLMSMFTYKCNLKHWIVNESIVQLMSIAKVHDSDLNYMTLEEYTNIKANENDYTDLLQEDLITPQSYINKDTIEEQITWYEMEAEISCYEKDRAYAHIINKLNEHHFKNSELEQKKQNKISEYTSIIEKEAHNNIKSLQSNDNKDINHLIKLCEDFISTYNNQNSKEIEKILEELKQKKLQQNIESGLSLLHEKYTEGPNCGKYKTNDIKTIISRTSSWLKKTNQKTVPEKEIGQLQEALARAFNCTTKKNDIEKWKNINSEYWMRLRNIVEESAINRIYKEIIL